MKDAYYFSHDSNAHNDPKILALRIEQGWAGVGLYWTFLEILRDMPDYKYSLTNNYLKELELRLSTAQATLETWLEHACNIGLLVKQNGFLYSESFLRRMGEVDTLRKKLSDAGKKGGIKSSQAKARLKPPSSNKVKESKGKESKEKESKEKENIPQSIYYFYAKNIKAGAAQDAIKNINKRLKEGFTKEDLIGRINTYKKQIIEKPTDFLIQANNFFGEKARFKDFEPIKIIEYGLPNPECNMCKGQGKYLIQHTGRIEICQCRIKKCIKNDT